MGWGLILQGQDVVDFVVSYIGGGFCCRRRRLCRRQRVVQEVLFCSFNVKGIALKKLSERDRPRAAFFEEGLVGGGGFARESIWSDN